MLGNFDKLKKPLKKSFFLGVTGMVCFGNFLYAFNNQNIQQKNQLPVIILSKNTKAGQIILKSQKEYLELLKKRIMNAQINENIIRQIRENNCEINNIKIVLARLIEEVERIKRTKASKKELQELYRLIQMQSNKIKELKKELRESKNAKLNLINNEINYLNRYIKNKTTKKVCRVIKIPVYKTKYSLKDIQGSYIKYPKPKEFIAQKNLIQYNYPLLWAKTNKYPIIKKGTHFKGDMWTYAGWVHVENQGWVRGFLLYPKVLQKKSFFNKKPVKYIEKVICETK